jgi:hypothetical protein
MSFIHGAMSQNTHQAHSVPAAAEAERDPARRVAQHEAQRRADGGAGHDWKWSKLRRP